MVDFRACFGPLTCCAEGELFSTVLILATGPACAFVLVLETKEYVLFLPSFFAFLVWRGMIVEVRNLSPVHTSDMIKFGFTAIDVGKWETM